MAIIFFHSPMLSLDCSGFEKCELLSETLSTKMLNAIAAAVTTIGSVVHSFVSSKVST